MLSKSDVEKGIDGIGNFIRIDKLNRFLKEAQSSDVKRFILLKLAEAYDSVNMPEEAAKAFGHAVIASITFRDKIKYCIEETKMHAKAGNFREADESMKKAFSHANSMQKEEILSEVKKYYMKIGEEYEHALKRGHAIKIFEHLAGMRLSEEERYKVKEKLLDLYDKTGNIRKYKMLKGGLD